MNEIPIEVAEKDLKELRLQLDAMQVLVNKAYFLSTQNDVDGSYYREVGNKVSADIKRGRTLEIRILNLYPTLK
jgi:hypothetical protein